MPPGRGEGNFRYQPLSGGGGGASCADLREKGDKYVDQEGDGRGSESKASSAMPGRAMAHRVKKSRQVDGGKGSKWIGTQIKLWHQPAEPYKVYACAASVAACMSDTEISLSRRRMLDHTSAVLPTPLVQPENLWT